MYHTPIDRLQHLSTQPFNDSGSQIALWNVIRVLISDRTTVEKSILLVYLEKLLRLRGYKELSFEIHLPIRNFQGGELCNMVREPWIDELTTDFLYGIEFKFAPIVSNDILKNIERYCTGDHAYPLHQRRMQWEHWYKMLEDFRFQIRFPKLGLVRWLSDCKGFSKRVKRGDIIINNVVRIENWRYQGATLLMLAAVSKECQKKKMCVELCSGEIKKTYEIDIRNKECQCIVIDSVSCDSIVLSEVNTLDA